jgi:hypothetical protein
MAGQFFVHRRPGGACRRIEETLLGAAATVAALLPCRQTMGIKILDMNIVAMNYLNTDPAGGGASGAGRRRALRRGRGGSGA